MQHGLHLLGRHVHGVRRPGATVLRHRLRQRRHLRSEHAVHGLRRREPGLLRGERVHSDRHCVRGGQVRDLRRERAAVLRGKHLQRRGRHLHERRVRRVRGKRKSVLHRLDVRGGVHLLDVDQYVHVVRWNGTVVLRWNGLQQWLHLRRGQDLWRVRRGRTGMLRHELRIGRHLFDVDVEVRGVRRDGTGVLCRQRLHQRDERLRERDVRGVRRRKPALLRRQHLRQRERVRRRDVHAVRRNGTAVLRGRLHRDDGRLHERHVRHVRRQRAGLLPGVQLCAGVSLLDLHIEVRGVRGGQAALLRDELQHRRDLRDQRNLRGVRQPQSAVLRERLLRRDGLRVGYLHHVRRGEPSVLRGERLLDERVHLLGRHLRDVRGGDPTVLRVELQYQQPHLHDRRHLRSVWWHGPGVLRGGNLHRIASVHERNVRKLRWKRPALLHQLGVRHRIHLLVDDVDLHGVRRSKSAMLRGTDVRHGNDLRDVWDLQRLRRGHTSLLRDEL